MITLRCVLLIVGVNIAGCSFAQNASTHDLIRGKWETEDEQKNVLLFKNKLIYHIYDGHIEIKYKYHLIDSCIFANNKGHFIMFINELHNDTAYFEILGLTQKRLTLLDLSSNGQIWVLKRKNNTK